MESGEDTAENLITRGQYHESLNMNLEALKDFEDVIFRA